MSKVRAELEVPEELLNEFDNAIKGHYANRSEALRASMRILIERLKQGKVKGELLKDLEEFLKTKLAKPEEKESIRNAEVERFTKKWGTPDSKGKDENPSHHYITLSKTQKVKLGDQTIAELEISNSPILAKGVHERVQKGFGKYDINLYDKNLEPLLEYFKSKGFTTAEEQLLQTGVMHHVLKTYGSRGREDANALKAKGYDYYGVFAADKEDCVFIAYREVMPAKKDRGIEVMKEISWKDVIKKQRHGLPTLKDWGEDIKHMTMEQFDSKPIEEVERLVKEYQEYLKQLSRKKKG